MFKRSSFRIFSESWPKHLLTGIAIHRAKPPAWLKTDLQMTLLWYRIINTMATHVTVQPHCCIAEKYLFKSMYCWLYSFHEIF